MKLSFQINCDLIQLVHLFDMLPFEYEDKKKWIDKIINSKEITIIDL